MTRLNKPLFFICVRKFRDKLSKILRLALVSTSRSYLRIGFCEFQIIQQGINYDSFLTSNFKNRNVSRLFLTHLQGISIQRNIFNMKKHYCNYPVFNLKTIKLEFKNNFLETKPSFSPQKRLKQSCCKICSKNDFQFLHNLECILNLDHTRIVKAFRHFLLKYSLSVELHQAINIISVQ